VNLLYIILQDIDSVSSIKSVPAGGESPKVDKPRVLQLRIPCRSLQSS
jgi:hypothetical protein